jgi:restriction system protein
MLAVIGQYVLPANFLVLAALSGLRAWERSRIREDALQIEPGLDETALREARRESRDDHHLYPVWTETSENIREAVIVDTTRWTPELLFLLEWKRFEELCAWYFEALGFRSTLAAAGPDGGIDIHVYAGESEKPGIIVQCKAWRSYRVGVKEIRELFGVMTAEKVVEGVFITTSTFTKEARDFAEGKDMHLIDGADFLAKLLALLPEQQERLLVSATQGDFTTPTCASCGIKMVRRAPESGTPFWGCPNYPRCRTTLH